MQNLVEILVQLILRGLYRLILPEISLKTSHPRKAELTNALGPYHELREVGPGDVPEVDLGFYDTAQRTLEKAGFRKLGDVEDLTLSAAFPKTRTFFRIMATGDGHVVAYVYHVKIRGVRRWLALALRAFRFQEERVVDLDSWFENETFVSTSNSYGGSLDLKRPPRIAALFQPGLGIEPLVTIHQARLWDALRGGLAPLPVTTLQQAVDAFNAMQEIKASFRAAQEGILDEKDMGVILKGQPKGLIAEIASGSKTLA